MSKISLIGAILLLLGAQVASGQDYTFEMIDAAPEAEGVSEEIAELISDQGFRVKRGSSRTVCELWLRKELAIDPEFKPTAEKLYPFTPGQLIGLAHFPRRGSEFRDQTISSGWYTLRFGLQPVDGNHVGTSPTRDFLLLVQPEQDELVENWETKELYNASAAAAGSSHPALLCLQKPVAASDPEIRYDETHDWWVLHLLGNGVANEKSLTVPIDLVVAGHAAE